MQPASEIFKRTGYIASLITRPEDVDPLLDSFRKITSHSDPSLPLSPSDLSILQGVQKQLETYLVTQEKIRSFTPESLQLQIEQHMQGGTDRKALFQLWLVSIVSCLFAVVAASLPFLSGVEQRVLLGAGVLFSALTVGAAWLFLTALPSFTSQLRRAFLLICVGVTVLGLSLLQAPVIYLFDVQREPLINLLFPIPLLVAAVLFHAGNLFYVRLLGIRNFWTSIKPIVIAGVVLSGISWFLPHPEVLGSELIHDLAVVVWVWITLMPVASAIILPMAARRLPDLYKPSILSLFHSMFSIIAVTSYLYMLTMFTNPYEDRLLSYLLFGTVVIMAVALLRAGFIFNKVSKY